MFEGIAPVDRPWKTLDGSSSNRRGSDQRPRRSTPPAFATVARIETQSRRRQTRVRTRATQGISHAAWRTLVSCSLSHWTTLPVVGARRVSRRNGPQKQRDAALVAGRRHPRRDGMLPDRDSISSRQKAEDRGRFQRRGHHRQRRHSAARPSGQEAGFDPRDGWMTGGGGPVFGTHWGSCSGSASTRWPWGTRI